METDGTETIRLSILALLAPVLMALGIAAGVLDLWLKWRALVWVGLLMIALGLAFSGYVQRLFKAV
jgi:small-conductance mechanosensitive channel